MKKFKIGQLVKKSMTSDKCVYKILEINKDGTLKLRLIRDYNGSIRTIQTTNIYSDTNPKSVKEFKGKLK